LAAAGLAGCGGRPETVLVAAIQCHSRFGDPAGNVLASARVGLGEDIVYAELPIPVPLPATSADPAPAP